MVPHVITFIWGQKQFSVTHVIIKNWQEYLSILYYNCIEFIYKKCTNFCRIQQKLFNACNSMVCLLHTVLCSHEACCAMFTWSIMCFVHMKHNVSCSHVAYCTMFTWSIMCYVDMKHNVLCSHEAQCVMFTCSILCYVHMKHTVICSHVANLNVGMQ